MSTKKAMLMLMLVAVLLCGCTETQKRWGKNDPPATFTENFGDSNLARLTYALVQQHDRNTKVLNHAAKRIIVIESDPNDLVRRVERLEVITEYAR